MKRRQILKIGVTSGVALTGLGTAAARRRSHDGPAGQESGEFEVSESSSQEVNKVRQSSPYQDITGDLPRRANLFNFDRAKTVRKKGEGDSYKLAVPIQGAESFDPVSATEGLHAHVNSDIDEVDIVARYEGLADERSDSGPAAAQNLESASTISASTSPQGGQAIRALGSGCQYSDITPGYKCNGVYDTEEACTVIGAAAVLIPADDVTGVGVIDDVLLPAVEPAAAGCALEQAIEMGIADWLNACSTGNWVWEVYTARWWNPVPQKFLAIPRCG